MIKIKSVFRTFIQRKSELLHSKIHVFHFNQEKISSNALSEMQMSISNFNLTEINYRKADQIDSTFRVIEPCAIFATDNKWIIIAWCHLRKDYRAFRVDRIQHFKILPTQFEDINFDLKSFYKSQPYNP